MALAVTAVFLAPAVAGAPHPGTVTTYRAPYAGYALTASAISKIGCGAHASTPGVPSFLVSSGKATGVDQASAKVCGSPHSFTRGAVNTSEGLFGGNWTVSASGVHHMTVHWSLTWVTNLSAVAGNATQLAVAQASISVSAEVSDATSGAVFLSSNHWSQSNMTAHGFLNWSRAAQKVVLFVNGSLQTGHTYYFVTFVTVSVAAFVSQPGTSMASARVDMGSGGNHASLLSMTVS